MPIPRFHAHRRLAAKSLHLPRTLCPETPAEWHLARKAGLLLQWREGSSWRVPSQFCGTSVIKSVTGLGELPELEELRQESQAHACAAGIAVAAGPYRGRSLESY